MKSGTSFSIKMVAGLLIFGVLIYLLNRFAEPYIGMVACSVITSLLMAGLLATYLKIGSKEKDERERLLRLQADSAALYIVIAGLLAASIFFPETEIAMAFWGVLGLAVGGRVITFLYQKYK